MFVICGIRTGGSELLSGHSRSSLISSLDQLDHGGNRRIVATIDLVKDALKSLVLINGRISLLSSSSSGQSQELRDDQQVFLLLFGSSSSSLGSRCAYGILQLLCGLLGESLFKFRLLSLGLCLVLCVKLFVL
jgi:hypothetical protein